MVSVTVTKTGEVARRSYATKEQPLPSNPVEHRLNCWYRCSKDRFAWGLLSLDPWREAR